MKKLIIVTLIFVINMLLNSFEILYSESILKSEINHISNFVRIDPPDSLPIPLKTDVWIWHDNDNLNLYLKAEVNDNFVKGKIAKRDEWVECDFFRIQIITDVHNYYAYVFSAFPLGNKYDGIRRPDLNIDYEWNSDYNYKSIISDTLWTVTMRIPFKDLRFYGKPPYNWKIILTRYFQRSDEYYSFPCATIDMGKDYFRTAYDVKINGKINKKNNYRITPYLIKKYDLVEKLESFDPENIGLDFSYNPTSSSKIKLSFNPDFSDVPMDEVEDNFNILYPPSYPENRYFFIEDLDAFGIENILFYSRHIMQPQYAIKFTGNSERFTYGFLSARDKKITENNEYLNNDDFYNILAFKPKWQNLSIQMTLLNRMNKNYNNEVFIVKPVWEFYSNHTIWYETDLSYYDKNTKKKGYLISTGYNGKIGNFNWSSSIYKCSKDFTTDMGLLYTTNFLIFNGSINYKKDINSKIFKSLGSNIWFHRENESNNSLYQQNGNFGIWSSFKQKFNLNVNIDIGQEKYEGIIHNLSSIYFNFSIWKYSFLNLRINYGINKTLVYYLKDVFNKNNFSLGLWGDIGTILSYKISAQQIRYFDFPNDDNIDDQYWLGNIDLVFNFSNTFSLTNGLRLNNYESSFSTKYLGFFSNIRYEFKENCNLYIGYKTAQDEIEQEFNTEYKQAYMKISYTF